MSPVIAALDVGGSSVKRGFVTLPDQVTLVDPVPINALAPKQELLEFFARMAADLVNGADECEDLAVAFPRPFDMDKGVPYMRGVNKFDSIYGVELRPVLQSLVDRDLRISFCGDSAAAAIGEAAVGAGSRFSRVLMITLGTGFGSALVVDGAPVETHKGNAVEDLHLADSGVGGSADDALSAWGLGERIGVPMSKLAEIVNDPGQARVLERFGHDLSRFLQREAPAFEPDAIVIGGGLADAFDLFGPAIDSGLAIPALPAQLGQRAALIGAATSHRIQTAPDGCLRR